MRARRAWLKVVVVVLGGWQRSAHAQLVEPPTGPAFELRNEMKAAPIEVPLTLVDQATLKAVSVARVDAADRQQPALKRAFDAKLDGSKLELSVDFAQLNTPRSYKVWLELAGTVPHATGPASDAKQLLSLELVLPPAKLEAIAPFVVTHEQWPWGSYPSKDASFELPLHESSEQTSLTGLLVEPAHPLLNGDLQVQAHIEPKAPPTLAAGARARALVTAHDLEVGTTKGNLVIAAQQLAEPVKVPFEIRTRIFDFLIIPWYLLFGWIGWLVRHRLQQASLRAELRVQTEALRKRADAEIASSPSDELERTLKVARRALDEASTQDDSDAWQAAVVALRTALEDAQKKRREIVDQLLNDATLRDTALAVAYDLPNGLKLDGARALLGEAKRLLLDDRPREAREALVKQQVVLDDVCTNIDAWSRDVQVGLERFEANAAEETAANIPSAAREGAATLLTALQALLAKLEYNAAKPPAQLGEYLTDANDANLDLRHFFAIVRDACLAEVNAAVQACTDAGQDPTPIRDAVATVPPETADVTETELEELATAMRDCSRAVATLLKADEAKGMARAGKLAAAIRKNRALTQGDVLAPEISDSASDEAPASRAAEPQKSRRVAAASPVMLVRSVAPPPAVPAATELRTIQTTRSLVSAAILSVIAWMVYRTSWVGTVSDFAGIAAVAFFTDFTLDAVLDAVAKVKKPA